MLCFGSIFDRVSSWRLSNWSYLSDFSSPCNFVEDLDIIGTPGSSTRSMGTATKDYTRDRDCMVPTTSELEEFFAYAEQQKQRLFMEK